MNRVRLVLFVALSLIVAACSSGSDRSGGEGSAGDAPARDEPIDNSIAVGPWILREGSVGGQPLVLVPDYDVTLTVEDDGRIGGTAACNGYGGTAAFGTAGTFGVLEMGMTSMGCIEPGVQELEIAFTEGLSRSTSFEIVEGQLRFSGPGSELIFDAAEPVETVALVGTTWVLDTLIDGDLAMTSQGEASLLLADDGTFTGSTGCRSISGEWVVSGATLQFTSWGADGNCTPDLTAQDGVVIAVLEGPMSVSISGPVLTLTTQGGGGLGFRSDLG